ncbi:4966_t:CDS:2 [Racocetra fulgida]|uniref:4966_t:CDS:1 n=1 Tax=Racocetra fulgida TaxID=60492 RepID=A0A9N8ZZM3_9GLOM|nr:4966_t:CDS:2 [Racocetra fulgida]
MLEEKIILNIGGIKYETLRSTLTAQPETLLGTIFQNQSEYIKNSVNGNEYFFNRNGKAFYYIMEFYRTGKLLWSVETDASKVTYQQLKEELDYFKINKSKTFSSMASETVKSTIDRFISHLEKLIIDHYIGFENKISLLVRNNRLISDSRLGQFKDCAFDILSNIGGQIGKRLVETFSELELKWEYQRHGYSLIKIDITFSSPVEKLLKFECDQAHIIFPQVPINTSEEKIILNVGGKKYETFQSTLIAQPETFLGVMFQDRNTCMRHPINGNEYFFDRNSEAFYYIMEFYRTGKLTLPIISGQVTHRQLEEELDYFQIPFNKSTVLCSLALETVRQKVSDIILAFEELVIRCCNYLKNDIQLEIKRNYVHIIEKGHNYLEDLHIFCLPKFTGSYYSTLDNMDKHIGDHLVEVFSDLGLTWKFSRAQDNSLYISISFNNVYNILNER